MNHNFELVIEPMYDSVINFFNGVCIVKKNHKYGLINKENDIILPFEYMYMEDYNEYLLAFPMYYTISETEDINNFFSGNYQKISSFELYLKTENNVNFLLKEQRLLNGFTLQKYIDSDYNKTLSILSIELDNFKTSREIDINGKYGIISTEASPNNPLQIDQKIIQYENVPLLNVYFDESQK